MGYLHAPPDSDGPALVVSGVQAVPALPMIFFFYHPITDRGACELIFHRR